MGPWFDAGKTHSLIEDQYRRKTAAARLGYEQHHVEDENPFVSPALSSAHVWQAKKSPCEEREAAPSPVPARQPRPALWESLVHMFAWLRCWLGANA